MLKLEDDLYLIHSNYLDGVGVLIERTEESEVFGSYGVYYVTELSTNESLLDAWVHGRAITIAEV